MTPPFRKVTLVVAMRNEQASIRRCLASIADQDYPADRLEVLVYDGLSTDGSLQRPERFAAGAGLGGPDEPASIQAAAWNAGIGAATGDILGIVSGHAELGPAVRPECGWVLMRPAPTWSAAREGRRGRWDWCGDRPRDEHPVRRRNCPPPLPHGTGRGGHRFHGRRVATTWLRYSFDESFVRNQDDELSYRLLDGGGASSATPQSRAYRSRSAFGVLWYQYRHTGPGRFGFCRRTPVRRDVVTWRRWRLLAPRRAALLGVRSRRPGPWRRSSWDFTAPRPLPRPRATVIRASRYRCYC